MPPQLRKQTRKSPERTIIYVTLVLFITLNLLRKRSFVFSVKNLVGNQVLIETENSETTTRPLKRI
jgi:hypothetical protein